MLDIFNHFMPSLYFERLQKLAPTHAAATAFPRLRTLWDLDARLKLLDQFGELQQVLSLANPPLEYLGSPADTPELARMANDGLADLCSRFP
ncbi:MAG: amidohydrolase, partial [Xanthobacteraceae bacterium]|nr:amidohydrolase [Xanthobacteraceae bacterium]